MNCIEEFFRDIYKFFRDDEKKDETVLKDIISDFSIEEKRCDKVEEKVENKVEEKFEYKVEEKNEEKVEEKNEEKVEEKNEEKVEEKNEDFEHEMVIIETTSQILLAPIEYNENYI
jgi:hypothetical protein